MAKSIYIVFSQIHHMFGFMKSRRTINKKNQEQGREGEKKIKEKYQFMGYKVKRTGRGHDFKVERDGLLGKESKFVEVKTGNSPLSKRQKQAKSRHGSRYVVERLQNTGLGLTQSKTGSNFTSESGSGSKRKKKSSGFDLFGSILTIKSLCAVSRIFCW